MPRFFGSNNKALISDASIKKWILSVNSPSTESVVHRQTTSSGFSDIRKHQFVAELPGDQVLEAAYAETRSFVDRYIRRDELADIADELKFFDDYDKTIESDLQFEDNGIPKLSSLPRAPSPPPVDYDQPDDTIVNAIIEKLLEKPIFPRELNEAGLLDDTPVDLPIVTRESRIARSAGTSSRSATVENRSTRTADFHARMKVRQEIVKQNREKREAEERARKREEVARREMMAEAKRREAMEQKERELKERAEEEEIKKEMMKIKQQMENKRKLILKLNEHKRAVSDVAEAAARAELDLEVAKKEEVEEQVRLAMEEERRLKLLRLEQIMKTRHAENVKLLQRCFKSWYNMILEDRLSVARFRAVADWRRIVRTWNRWRFCTNNRIVERAAKQHADEMRNDYRRETFADNHYKRRILLISFREWRLFVDREKELKAAEAAKEGRRAKMASFLAAATATAVVVQSAPQVEDVTICDPIISQGIDELFSTMQKGFKLDLKQLSSGEEDKKKQVANGAASKKGGKALVRKSTRKVASAGNSRTQKPSKIPSEDDINSSSENEQEKDEPLTGNLRLSPDRKAVRQQQIINLQRERIRDQQMLIKELSYARRQTEMVQQIAKYEDLLRGLEQLTKLANKKSPNVPTTVAMPTSAHQANTPMVVNKILSSNTAVADTSAEKKAEAIETNTGENATVSELPASQRENLQPNAEGERSQTDGVSTQSVPVGELQLQLHEVVQLFHATKKSPAIAMTPSTAQSSNRRVRSACSTAIAVDSEFTKKMEERAEMRRRMKEEREKKKQETEQQRIEEEKLREEEQKRLEEEEKRAKVEELKRKRQLEKEREEQRQAQLEREQELLRTATDGNLKRILRHWGWLPWRRLVEHQRQRWQTAVERHSVNTQRRFLIAWAEFVHTDVAERRTRANTFYDKLVVSRCFVSWKKYGNYMAILEQRGDRHYRAALLVETFKKWDRFVDHQRRKEIRDEEAAELHNLKRMMRFVFKAWRQIPLMAREERQRVQRLEDMRRRVAEILPDYNPNKTSTPPPPQTTLSIKLDSSESTECKIADQNKMQQCGSFAMTEVPDIC